MVRSEFPIWVPTFDENNELLDRLWIPTIPLIALIYAVRRWLAQSA